MAAGKNIYNIQFWMLCLSSFLFFASFNMIIPELPDYLTSLGGAEYKGLIISLFTLTAGLSRPFSGKLADHVGRIPVMVYGAAVCVVCSLIYPLVTTVFMFLLLRFVHGMSTGFKPTGTSAFMADVVPFKYRGEALGMLGLFGSLGMASGPAIGSFLASEFNWNVMFVVSSLFALASVLVLSGMKESLAEPEKFRPGLLKINWKEVYEPRVKVPSLVMMLSVFSFGIILTIIPDYSEYLGLQNKGWFFTTFTVASIMVRFAAGKASDKWGRQRVLRLSTIMLTLAMVIIGLANSSLVLLIAGFIFGLSVGMTSPTIFAWTIDLSHKNHRGRAMATMYIALEIGIGTGAFISGWLYNNDASMFKYVFWMGGFFAFLSFLYLVYLRYRKRRPRAKSL